MGSDDEDRDDDDRDGRGGALDGLTVLVPPGITPASLSQIAYYRIRDLLVTLALPPGSGLDESELRDRLQLGRTPVREAVRRLADEGLVTVYARRGMVVAPVEVRDLKHVSEVRVDLEGLGARLAAERADVEDRRLAAELLAEIEQARHAQQAQTIRALIRTDQRVHHCVHRATRNRYLQDTLGTYLTLSLRLWFLGLERVQRLDEAVDEHVDVLTAVIEGDADRAEQAARAHVTGFWQEMREVLIE
ncbi:MULTISPECIES: GntR family transcriptional regulator [unclassified Brachybacterium]|uniref:GntR family transcriptional regulator n=1 Tax=unclassified Brachybacterium TaxID=2623841 RepID=UPI00360E7620